MRIAVREPVHGPAFPLGHRPPGGVVADRVHLQRLDGAGHGTDDALLLAGRDARLGAFTERLLLQQVRSAHRPPGRRLGRLLGITRRASVAAIDIPGRERRLPPGVKSGVLTPRGR